MIWYLLCAYVVLMPLPKGVVVTELHKGRLQVGDQEHWVRPGHKLLHVRKVRGTLAFTFEEK